MEIDVATADGLLKAGTARLIDVREEWEYRRRQGSRARALIPLKHGRGAWRSPCPR